MVSFATMNTIIEDMETEYSKLTNSDDGKKESSHLQFEEAYWFQGVHQNTVVIPNKGL